MCLPLLLSETERARPNQVLAGSETLQLRSPLPLYALALALLPPLVTLAYGNAGARPGDARGVCAAVALTLLCGAALVWAERTFCWRTYRLFDFDRFKL